MQKIRKQKALFLDRDGVINVDKGYVGSIHDFEFLPGLWDFLEQFRDYLFIVITNQSGIERGFYTEDDFLELMAWLREQFIKHGFSLHDVFFCPFLNDEKRRKPAPGMLLEAIEKHDIDIENSLFIGDKDSDLKAGKAAKISSYLLENGDFKALLERIKLKKD